MAGTLAFEPTKAESSVQSTSRDAEVSEELVADLGPPGEGGADKPWFAI